MHWKETIGPWVLLAWVVWALFFLQQTFLLWYQREGSCSTCRLAGRLFGFKVEYSRFRLYKNHSNTLQYLKERWPCFDWFGPACFEQSRAHSCQFSSVDLWQSTCDHLQRWFVSYRSGMTMITCARMPSRFVLTRLKSRKGRSRDVWTKASDKPRMLSSHRLK